MFHATAPLRNSEILKILKHLKSRTIVSTLGSEQGGATIILGLLGSAETSFDSVTLRSARSPLEVNVAHPANVCP